MDGTIPLISPVRSTYLLFKPLCVRTPSIEYVGGDTPDKLNKLSKPLPWIRRIFPKYPLLYEVDVSSHRLEAHLRDVRLPSKDDGYFFEATVYGSLRVTDPVKAVQSNVVDGLPIAFDHLVNVMREITRKHDIADCAEAEKEVNDKLRYGKYFYDEGITIQGSRVSLLPDARHREHREALVNAEREGLLNSRTREFEVKDAERRAQIEEISQSVRTDLQARAIHVLGNQRLSTRQLIGLYLQSHPKDGARVLELLVRYEQRRCSRPDTRPKRWRDLFHSLVESKYVAAGDMNELKDGTKGGFCAPPASVDERVTSDVVLPVYLVVDESVATALDDLNAGMNSLHSGLVNEPDAVCSVRLCVVGFAADPQARMELKALTRRSSVPSFQEHKGGVQGRSGSTPTAPRFGPVFQELYERLPRDIGMLRGEGFGVHRPVVFFLTAQSPKDGSTWHDSHGQLVDRRTRWYAPHIVVYGIDTADRAHVGRIATQPDFAFFAQGDRAPAIRNAFTAIQRSVVKSGHAFSENRITMIISRPRGFDLAL